MREGGKDHDLGTSAVVGPLAAELDVVVAGDDGRANVAARPGGRALHLLVLQLDVAHVAREHKLALRVGDRVGDTRRHTGFGVEGVFRG